MELSQLRTLIHVAELGSLSKAADRIGIAQPALSRQIRMLEEELSVRLFTRHGRGMVLTDKGREILEHATRVMTELEEIRATASDLDAPLRGRIAIGFPPTVADILSLPLVAAFGKTHPQVELRLVGAYTGHLLDWLHRGEIDVAILYDPQFRPIAAVGAVAAREPVPDRTARLGPFRRTLDPVQGPRRQAHPPAQHAPRPAERSSSSAPWKPASRCTSPSKPIPTRP